MKVIHFPADQGTNPYQISLISGLNQLGVHSDAQKDGDLALAKLVLFNDADILHLHWMHSKIVARSLPIALLRFMLTHLCLIYWIARRKHIVWTIHQITNHEGKRLWLDKLNSKIIARLATQCLVHGPSAVHVVSKELRVRDSKISVVYHPNYNEILSNSAPLVAPDSPRSFLFFGQIRAYKGVTKLINTLRRCELDVNLQVSGKPYSTAIQNEIQTAARGMSTVQLDLRFLPDDELRSALKSCDVVVLPFEDVFTSGSLLMALSASRPIVAPRIGLVEDYVDEDCAYLYDPKDKTGLAHALSRAAKDELILRKSEAARRRALAFDSSDVAQSLTELYRQVIRS